jgi:hypothetical protein
MEDRRKIKRVFWPGLRGRKRGDGLDIYLGHDVRGFITAQKSSPPNQRQSPASCCVISSLTMYTSITSPRDLTKDPGC